MLRRVRLRKREPALLEQLVRVQQIRAELSTKYKPEILSPAVEEQQQRQYDETKFMSKWQVQEIVTRARLRSLIQHYRWYDQIRLQE